MWMYSCICPTLGRESFRRHVTVIHTRRAFFWPCLVVASVAWGQVAFGAAKPKLAPDLKNLKGNDPVDVIVQFQSTPTDAQDQKVGKHGGVPKGALGGRAALY